MNWLCYTIRPGECKEIYKHFNAKGKVFFKIANTSGTNQLKFYWTKGPFGSNEHLGYLAREGVLDISGLIWGRLKVSGADSITKVCVTDNPQVAHSFSTDLIKDILDMAR
ncbi:hypothetical protein [Cyclobacterium salsum]|uniref:hypothetical protein n=1 Tax=Cyclobacterium salsum TaxID=2666329 RepID=UPI001390710E|nr:hypothetical protein [Cyclobacterium salsum]